MARPKTGRLVGELSWLAPLFAAVLIFGLWLVAKGSKGAEIATQLSLPGTFAGVIVSVLLFRLQERRDDEVKRRSEVSTPPGWRWTALTVTVVLAAGGALAYWNLIHKPDDNVTDRVTVGPDGRGMRDRSKATLLVPGAPPRRDNLALILTLSNTAAVGDCVSPASLDVALYVDGQQRSTHVTRSGRELRLRLRGVSHQARVTVVLTEPDPACLVDLGVAEAILYN